MSEWRNAERAIAVAREHGYVLDRNDCAIIERLCGDCTHCDGEGVYWPTPDPLSDYPDEPDAPDQCYACGGSGRREDQIIF